MGSMDRGRQDTMLNDRRKRVLRALVREYVRSAHPVGSKTLVEEYSLECSSATVRNDLAVLEETGHVFQPHTSAGRVPTDLGYRAFLEDALGRPAALRVSANVVSEVRERLRHVEAEISSLMQEASSLLSSLTRYAAIALAPTLKRSRVLRVDLVALSPSKVLVVLITNTGQVAKRVMDLDTEVSSDGLRTIEAALNKALDGRMADEVRSAAEEVAGHGPDAELLLGVVDTLFEMLSDSDEVSVYHGGTAALLEEPEFSEPEMVRSLVGLLEDGLLLARAVTAADAERAVAVRIGSENEIEQLENLSLVLAPWGGEDGGGYIGIVGPTRMEYLRAIRAVRCVADALNESLPTIEE